MKPRFRGRFGRPSVPEPSPFVVGLGRSGTTLLRLMLDAHPELAIPPETHFATGVIRMYRQGSPQPAETADYLAGLRRWGDFGIDREEMLERLTGSGAADAQAALRAFYEIYAAKQQKPRWGDRTPDYGVQMRRIARTLPEARFVHLIRDGRDAALSRARASGKRVRPQKAAARWRERIEQTRAQAARVPHYCEVRYEDLVREPEPTLRRILSFVDLEWDPAVLAYHERAAERLSEMDRDLPAMDGKGLRPAEMRVGSHEMTTRPPDPTRLARWREEVTVAELAEFEAVAGDLLAELGYELGSPTLSA
ncbi:MAG: sulfotransferase [bacterium]